MTVSHRSVSMPGQDRDCDSVTQGCDWVTWGCNCDHVTEGCDRVTQGDFPGQDHFSEKVGLANVTLAY